MEAQVAWDDEQAERSVAVLKAVADPSRYRLLWALSERELPVSRLAALIGAHVAATSQHLAKLRAAGLVVSRREGTRIFYRAAGPRVRELLVGALLAADEAAAGAGQDGEPAEPGAAAAAREQDAPARPAGMPRTPRSPRTVTGH